MKSSVIKGHDYDAGSRKLTVEFPNGNRHRYYDVPVEKYAAMTGNASPGAFFNAKIKGVHKGRKVG